jgi:predicted Zn-dependent protease with MMP-like domain
MNTTKKWCLKIYDSSGTFKDAFFDEKFAKFPEFSIGINDGFSALTLELAISIDVFSQDNRFLDFTTLVPTPKEGDFGKIFVFDKERPNGEAVYSGIFSGNELQVDGQKYTYYWNFVPNHYQLARRILRDGTDTTASYLSVDPSDMIKSIVYRGNTRIGYTGETVRTTGLSRSYTFIADYCLNAIKKLVGYLPWGWFFYIDADDKIYLKNHEQGYPTYSYWGTLQWGVGNWFYDQATDQVRTHDLFVSSNLSYGNLRTELADLTNRVVFMGGNTGTENLLVEKSFQSSIDNYGLYEEVQQDERVTTEASAEYKIDRTLRSKSLQRLSSTAEIIDSNFSDKGYDIERLKVGDRVIYRTDEGDYPRYKWGGFYWGFGYWKYSVFAFTGVPMIIKKITYRLLSAVLECDILPEQTAERIEDVNRDLGAYIFKDAPDTPTII